MPEQAVDDIFLGDLTDQIQYQPQAVVSRMLLKQESGRVVVFAFDAGEGLSEHTVAHEALLLVIDGEAEISIEDQSQRLGAGQMIRLPANRPHAVSAVERFKMLLIMIRD